MAEAAVDTAVKGDEKKADAVKADAEGGGMLDKVLSKLDSLHQRMDGFEEKMAAKKSDDGDLTLKHEGGDVEGEGKSAVDKKRKDAKKADAKGKGDEFPPEKDEEKKEDGKRGDGKRADWDENEDKDKKEDAKGKADGKKADAKAKGDFKGEDEQEGEVSKGDARADDGFVRVKAEDWTRLNQRLDSIESFTARDEDARASFADAQARADSVWQLFSKRAPVSFPGERLIDYRKRLVTPLRQYSDTWKDTKMSGVPDEVFEKIEGSIYADALKAAENPPDLPEGEMLRRDITDPETGGKRIEWIGKTSFIKEIARPGRVIASFNRYPDRRAG